MISNNVTILSCDTQIILIVYTGFEEASLLALWFGPIPEMADVTSQGSDQTALKCSLIRTFACHQCLMFEIT